MKPTEIQIAQLFTITTHDEAGAHFTESCDWVGLEELGLIGIDRPIHEITGIPYDQSAWRMWVTADGHALVTAYPELGPDE